MGIRRALVSSRQVGVALIAVLWLVAALSVIVASVSKSVREEVRAVSNARQAVVGQAIGLGAVQLVLQDMASSTDRPRALIHVDTVFRGVAVKVRVLPLNGLIDINNAPPALLAALFAQAGKLDARGADALAAAAVQVRSTRDARGRVIGFEAPEDLLRVPGIDYTLYAKISALVTADLRGSGRVNVAAAPAEVMAVLAANSASPVSTMKAQSGAGAGIDVTTLNGEFLDTNASTPRFQLQARVPLADGQWLLVSRTVDMSVGDNGLHWRTFHADVRFEPVPAERI